MFRSFLFAVCAFLVASSAASAAVQYSVLKLPHFTAGEDTYSYAMNDTAHVAAQNSPLSGNSVPLYWNGITLSPLPHIDNGVAQGINASDQLVGDGTFDDFVHRTYIFQGGSYTYIPGVTNASAINNVGQVVGTDNANHGYIYTA